MKKCKSCKQLKVRERNGIAISKYCVTCRKVKKQEKKSKHMLTKTYQESLRKRLHKKAWKLMSEWVRRKDANLDGYVECYTCPEIKQWKEMDAGHFFHGKLDFDSRNLRPQCSRCNKYCHGMGQIYAIRLAEELGVEGLIKLEKDANTTFYTVSDLDRIIPDLENKLKLFNN